MIFGLPAIRLRTLRWRSSLRASPVCVLAAALVLAGCTSNPISDYRLVSSIAPLQLPDRVVSVEEVAVRIESPDLLAIDDEMREFLDRYVHGIRHPRQRLHTLHTAINGKATFGIEYDALAGGSAQDVFHRGSANCLSYAALFVALAREAGLNAQFQWLEVRPQWTRSGERVMLRLHVNVAVQLRGRQEFMVDIEPLESRDIASSQLISDNDALALNHSNIAMEYLSREELEPAWLHAVRALQLSPQIAHLWVNIGAIYRAADQHRAAENSYLQALSLDPWERSAMNNLSVLYEIEGRDEEKQHWEQKVARYRNTNPYYHAWLGDQAGEEDDWPQAAQNYEKALSLRPTDSNLLSALAVIHTNMGELTEASAYFKRAIEAATLYSDIKGYEAQLNALERRQHVGT